jgi:hypothetical protein
MNGRLETAYRVKDEARLKQKHLKIESALKGI